MAYTFLLTAPASEYKNVYDLYGYPAESVVEVKQCLDTDGNIRTVHDIRYPGAISSSTHPNAPDGSTGFDTTNGDAYIKTATKPGIGIGGTWTKASP